MRRTTAAAILIVAASVTAASGYRQPSTDSTRLAMLGRVWLAAKFAHPRVTLTNRDWDQALVDVLPKVRAASDAAAFAEAVGTMLATLDDPVTRVVKTTPGAAFPQRAAVGPKIDTHDSQMAILDLRGRMATNPPEVTTMLEREAAAINAAGRLVIDLRGTVQPSRRPTESSAPSRRCWSRKRLHCPWRVTSPIRAIARRPVARPSTRRNKSSRRLAQSRRATR